MGGELKWILSDTIVMTKRGLLRYVRLPELLVFSTIQPVMFMLLFAYVFGGAIATPGLDYIDYLVPGILAQTIVFGSTVTGVGLAQDLSRGMTDRFHSLPMARSALLAGRTISDMIRNFFTLMLMLVVGVLIGFRFQDGFIHAAEAIALILLLGLAFSWISAAIGLAVKDPETVQVAGFIWLFPLVFASSVFVPVETMPTFLQGFAENSPVTMVVDAVRGLSLGGDLRVDIWPAIAWLTAIIAVFSTISVRLYMRRT